MVVVVLGIEMLGVCCLSHTNSASYSTEAEQNRGDRTLHLRSTSLAFAIAIARHVHLEALGLGTNDNLQ